MNSRNRQDNKTEFEYYFNQALDLTGLNLSAVAKEADLSRQQITALKQGEILGSPKLLRNLCNTFIDHGVPPDYLTPLILWGLGIGDRIQPAFYRNLPLDFSHFGHKYKGLESRAIVTDVLKEAIDSRMIDQTIKVLEGGAEYFYFLPYDKPDWEIVVTETEGRGKREKALLEKKAYCLKCPQEFFIYARMRIDNILGTVPSIYVSIGPIEFPSLHLIEPGGAVTNFVRHLSVICRKAKKIKSSGEHIVSYSLRKNHELLFELQ